MKNELGDAQSPNTGLKNPFNITAKRYTIHPALGAPSQPQTTIHSLDSLFFLKTLIASFLFPVDGNESKLN